MSALTGIWRTLDLPPTGDTAAIRKAYAKVLKTFDMDDEPARYIALREARDAAIAQAPYFDADAPDEEDDWAEDAVVVEAEAPVWDERWSEEDFDADERWQPEPPPPSPAALPSDDAEDAHVSAMQAHYEAVHAMLFPGDERQGQPLDRIGASVLVERVDALLADPRLEELAFHAQAEHWFAHVIADTPVRSDPILSQVIGHFGWLARRGRIDQSAAVAAVVARYDALVFVTELQGKKHSLHKAWRELRKPATENSRRSFGVNGAKVRELLGLIRAHHSTLEPQLDWYRVSLWDKPSRWPTDWRTWWWIIALIFIVVRIIVAAGDDTPRPSPVPVPVAESYASADIMLDPVLASLGGAALTMAILKDKNPKLYRQLQTNWTIASENRTPPAKLAKDTRTLLVDRYAAGVQRAPHGLLVELARLRLDKARLLRVHGWEACDDFFARGTEPRAWLNVDMYARRERLIARVLIETDGDPFEKPPSNIYKVSGAIVDLATKRAGISHDAFVQALRNKGTSETRCKAAIALGETALTLPAKQSDTILRNL